MSSPPSAGRNIASPSAISGSSTRLSLIVPSAPRDTPVLFLSKRSPAIPSSMPSMSPLSEPLPEPLSPPRDTPMRLEAFQLTAKLMSLDVEVVLCAA